MCRRIKEILLLVLVFTATNVKGENKSLFDFSINNTAIYTPGIAIISLQLNNRSVLAGEYQCDIQIFMDGMLLKRRSVSLAQESNREISLEFEGIERKTTCRCRVELFLDETPLEARELFLTLYPATFKSLIHQQKTVIWAYDESGRLQTKLDEMNVEYFNANFQLIRDFIPPDVILIGENTHPNNLITLTNTYENQLSHSVWIYLKQRSSDFCQGTNLKSSHSLQRSIECDFSEFALEELNPSELLEMLRKGGCLQILDDECTKNYIIKRTCNEGVIEGLLVYVKKGVKQRIYCQIPLLEEGPIGDILLSNLINYGVAKSQSANN